MSEGQKEEIRVVSGEVINFNYPEVVADNYRYKVAVDNHNALRHYGGIKYQIDLDIALRTTWWPILFFIFHNVH